MVPEAHSLEINHRSDRFALVHQVERRVDLFQRESVRDELVDQNLLVQVHLDQLRHGVQRFVAAESGAFPGSAGHQLEWSCAVWRTVEAKKKRLKD